MVQRTWKDFDSASNPPFPRDGDEHEFDEAAAFKPITDKDGQFAVEHKMGFVALWESQMMPIADEFTKGKKKVLVTWVKEGRYTRAVVKSSK